jgi:hypothetical protein
MVDRPSRLFWYFDGDGPTPNTGELVTLPIGEHPWSGCVATVDTAHGRKLTVLPHYRYPQWRIDLLRFHQAERGESTGA